ncbi:MAG: TRAP transporter small permease [Minwuia sp.]|uniref:TRAP transporter small permease n=1 Tax=Minwuia sp. TaxID=2493630 RepID=UPI003A893A48
MSSKPHPGAGGIIDQIEETLIAVILGLMTLITFANVIARYVFNDNILWALEATVFLFAWLVLLGASYCVKTTAHLGVDAIINMVSPAAQRVLALLSVACCLVFSGLLLVGAWEYWAPFAGKQVWYEVNDIPMPGFLKFLEDTLNEGEPYEKLPRFIPYFALPLGMALLTFRFLQAGWRILRGTQKTLIAAHEAEIDDDGESPVDKMAARDRN